MPAALPLKLLSHSSSVEVAGDAAMQVYGHRRSTGSAATVSAAMELRSETEMAAAPEATQMAAPAEATQRRSPCCPACSLASTPDSMPDSMPASID
jgi:hypothetical protein